jgi:hypothetical protein
MLRNVSPLAPMFVFSTRSAVAVCEAITLFAPVTCTVPPPVATKPAPDVVVIASPPPLKRMLPLLFGQRDRRVPLRGERLGGAAERHVRGAVLTEDTGRRGAAPAMLPLKVAEPPMLASDTARPELWVMDPA